MSVRRLADDSVQPASFAFSKDNQRWAKAKIKQYPKGRGQSAVIPLLMRAQEQEGWVSRAAIETVAEMLDMADIRVLEVATFYTQFQLQPVGTKAHVQVCGTTPCMLRGAEDLKAVCMRKIHAKAHQTSEDGALSWEEVECLGACVNAPMVAIGPDTYEDLTPARLEEIIDAFATGKGETIKPGPQNGRQGSAPLTGPTTLLDVPDPETWLGGGEAARAAAAAAEVAEPDDDAPLFARPEGDPDDLKLISGVGPVIENKLHALGIIKFAQVAAFSADDIARVDARLNFKGRIDRDNWLEQAAALAKGGVEEYRKVFGKDPR